MKNEKSPTSRLLHSSIRFKANVLPSSQLWKTFHLKHICRHLQLCCTFKMDWIFVSITSLGRFSQSKFTSTLDKHITSVQYPCKFNNQFDIQYGAKRSVHPCFLHYKSRNRDVSTLQIISGIVDSYIFQIEASMAVILRYNSKFYHKRFQNGNGLTLRCSTFST